jgi:hypothetical protein
MHNQGPELEELPPFVLPSLQAKGLSPTEWIHPIPGEPLSFRITGQEQKITLKSLNRSWERFAVYFTVT